ncbi:MT-A70 family protein [Oxytricha trifallax]|uniref:mRNA m(6)A methyltransferase n=1 Tax=Oxytricha trifallax TaxID=1172189 RepID=A0A073I068_9SPIT|nr:MT-A70 family protein [Oxytricha trifallax]
MLLKGYRIVDSICWIKKGSQKKYKKRPGFHLRHSKEICLVGLKGSVPPNMNAFSADDIIEEVPGQNSEKPEAINDIVEKLCPGGWYIELFARKNNLREGWVSVGDEL